MPGSGKTKIWRIMRGHKILPSRPRAIKSTGSAGLFYSQDVDNKIGIQENIIAPIIQKLGNAAIGTAVDGKCAARIIMHFSPRTAHIRDIFENNIDKIISGVESLLSDGEMFKNLLGIDQQTPNEAFQAYIPNSLYNDYPLKLLSLPKSVLDRVIFYLAREQFEYSFEETSPVRKKFFSKLHESARRIARNGQEKALDTLNAQHKPNNREIWLELLHWEIVAGPPGGAILPDCVVLAFDHNGSATSFLLADCDACVAIAMPLNEKALLVGYSREKKSLPPFDFNTEAARASYCFFLSSKKDSQIEALQPLIGECSSFIVDETVKSSLNSFQSNSLSNSVADFEQHDKPPTSSFIKGYTISFQNCTDASSAQEIAKMVERFINKLQHSLPLNRLEGITFAVNYPQALQEIDRGKLGIVQPATIDTNIGIGVGQNVLVVRDEVIMGHVVVDCSIANALISQDEQNILCAMNLLTYLLANVSLTEMIDNSFPNLLLQPIPECDKILFYNVVDGIPSRYCSSYISAKLGESDEKTKQFRQLLTDALLGMHTEVLQARFEYRFDGNLEKLLKIAEVKIGYVLMFAADLLGHTECLNVEAIPFDSPLDRALIKTGLKLWLPLYLTDLEKFRRRLGCWESFDEFTFFTVHVERLMWQLGIFPWKRNGEIRIDIPIESDQEKLINHCSP